jgi:hypothetical protein
VIPRLDSDPASDGTNWPARIARPKARTPAGSVHRPDPDVLLASLDAESASVKELSQACHEAFRQHPDYAAITASPDSLT